MDKPVVVLYELNGVGLIIEYPSGVRYTNQAGGYACLQPEIEGVFVPGSFSVEILEKLEGFFIGPKWKGCCYKGIDEETADFLDELFSHSILTVALKVNRDKLADSVEAWIHVIVSPDGLPSELWSGFDNASGIVTWANSD